MSFFLWPCVPEVKAVRPMLDLAFVLTIFMVTLGPIKAIPGFYAQSKDLEAADRWRLAVKGTLLALAISLVLRSLCL